MAVKINLSALEAVDVIVGAVPAGHLTEAGQVTVREPVPSCFCINVKLLPATGVGKVYVILPPRVMICTDPFAKSNVIVDVGVELNTSSV
jgi:hypothetical protein